MTSGPSKTAEAIVAVLVPPACREEVLGDLFERFTSPRQYALDALRTVPLVILGRIRRTSDAQILLIEALALYGAFLGAAKLTDGAVLGEPWGLLWLAIPAGMAILGLVLEDAYAKPRRRSGLGLARGPVLGLVFVLASQEALRTGNPGLVLPRWITFCGCGMSFLLSCAVRMWFPPLTDQLQGANAPAGWLKQAGGSPEDQQVDMRFLKAVFLMVTGVIVCVWMIARAAPKLRVVPILIILLAAHQVWKRT